MKFLKSKWLGALAFVALAGLAVAQVRAYASGGDDTKKPAPASSAKQDGAKAAASKAAYAARLATFKKELAGCKTSLIAAITAAEASTQGRAHAADVELGRDQKLHLVIGLLVGEKLVEVSVDPVTGKVMKTVDDDDDGDEDEDEDGDEEGDEDEDDGDDD